MIATPSLASLGFATDALLDTDALVRGEGTVRPWLPFKANTMRLYGNNKTNPTPEGKEYGRRNITGIGPLVSVVRGCGLARAHNGRGCYGNCYNCENMARYHIKYWIPVPQVYNERLLARDLKQFRSTRKKHGYQFIRTGDNGEPSFSWDNVVPVSELTIAYGFPLLVVTKTPVRAEDTVLERLADSEVVIHGSVSALDPARLREQTLDLLDRYAEIGGRAVRRVVTAPFKSDLEYCWHAQDDLMSEGVVLQQPLRVTGKNPLMHLFDEEQFGPTFNHTTGELTNRWRTAGDLYQSQGCYAPSCYECHNQCLTGWDAWKGEQFRRRVTLEDC